MKVHTNQNLVEVINLDLKPQTNHISSLHASFIHEGSRGSDFSLREAKLTASYRCYVMGRAGFRVSGFALEFKLMDLDLTIGKFEALKLSHLFDLDHMDRGHPYNRSSKPQER